MVVTITPYEPVILVFVDRPKEVLFMYNNIQVTKRDIKPGYWLFWQDVNGHCFIKQFY